MARDIQKLLEFNEWRNFCNVIEKAKIACQKSHAVVGDHFVEVNKKVSIGFLSIALLKLFVFPLVSLFILILGNGYFLTFVSLRLDLAQVSSEMIGLVTASFYTGVLLASFLAPPWIRRLGHLRTWILLCGINGLLIAAHVSV